MRSSGGSSRLPRLGIDRQSIPLRTIDEWLRFGNLPEEVNQVLESQIKKELSLEKELEELRRGLQIVSEQDTFKEDFIISMQDAFKTETTFKGIKKRFEQELSESFIEL